ncbi:hypothetical protein K438DRAFT_1772880 [Mycena galopus ATCC 62051]|nr:hypothetical protein K438DRAFT_1772880 [Mycena galopus ATCC 62051]
MKWETMCPPYTHWCMVVQGSRHGDARLMPRQCTVRHGSARSQHVAPALPATAAPVPGACKSFPVSVPTVVILRATCKIPIPNLPPCPQPQVHWSCRVTGGDRKGKVMADDWEAGTRSTRSIRTSQGSMTCDVDTWSILHIMSA